MYLQVLYSSTICKPFGKHLYSLICTEYAPLFSILTTLSTNMKLVFLLSMHMCENGSYYFNLIPDSLVQMALLFSPFEYGSSSEFSTRTQAHA